jgi:hypothetical protein
VTPSHSQQSVLLFQVSVLKEKEEQCRDVMKSGLDEVLTKNEFLNCNSAELS